MKSRPSIDEIPGPEKIVRNTELAWDDLGFQSLSLARARLFWFFTWREVFKGAELKVEHLFEGVDGGDMGMVEWWKFQGPSDQ